ncbi:MAG: PAS domain-containing protein [Fidelibacterota bacterium]
MNTTTVQKIISDVMADHGFRHKYQVAKYFGVTPQAVSTWLTNGNMPSKHILKYQSELANNNPLPTPAAISGEKSISQLKSVIDYLITENITLKNQIARLNQDLENLRSSKGKGDLIEKINAETLYISGRISDGVITDIQGNWPQLMGYNEKDLMGHKYDREDLIHPDEFERTKRHQRILRKSEGIKETRFSTIQRWKHGKTGQYIMLSMVWYANIENDLIDIVAKPIDSVMDSNYISV